jgi:hypothetical protein
MGVPPAKVTDRSAWLTQALVDAQQERAVEPFERLASPEPTT